MNTIDKIKNAFHPDIYTKVIPTTDELKLCLLQKKGLARYCLVVVDFDSDKAITEQVDNTRKLIRKHTSALWMFREVGIYIVFLCEEMPTLTQQDLEIDKTGFHAVIVQGIHLLSGGSEHLYNHSKWLNHYFGGTVSIANQLKAITI